MIEREYVRGAAYQWTPRVISANKRPSRVTSSPGAPGAPDASCPFAALESPPALP